jgi:DNA polymerase-4
MLIRLLGIKLNQLIGGTQQLNMFEDTKELVELYQTIDRIKKRYGSGAIKRASGYY